MFHTWYNDQQKSALANRLVFPERGQFTQRLRRSEPTCRRIAHPKESVTSVKRLTAFVLAARNPRDEGKFIARTALYEVVPPLRAKHSGITPNGLGASVRTAQGQRVKGSLNVWSALLRVSNSAAREESCLLREEYASSAIKLPQLAIRNAVSDVKIDRVRVGTAVASDLSATGYVRHAAPPLFRLSSFARRVGSEGGCASGNEEARYFKRTDTLARAAVSRTTIFYLSITSTITGPKKDVLSARVRLTLLPKSCVRTSRPNISCFAIIAILRRAIGDRALILGRAT